MICLALHCSGLRAEDFFLSDTSAGRGNGCDKANAFDTAFFNNSENWNAPLKIPGKIGPGDTVHVVGTISHPIAFQKEGVHSQPITLLFASGSSFAAPTWNQSGSRNDAAIVIAKSHVVLDGGDAGLVCSTDNGTEMSHRSRNLGIAIVGANDVQVKNLQIGPVYARNESNEPTASRTGGAGIFLIGKCSDILIDHCRIFDVYRAVLFAFATSHHFEVSHCSFSRMAVGITIGPEEKDSLLNGVLLHDNQISIGDNWRGSPNIHRAGIHSYSTKQSPNSQIVESRIFGNIFRGNLSGNATAYCFLEGANIRPLIYNNLFDQRDSGSGGDGFLALKGTTEASVLNNTFLAANNSTEIGINIWSIAGLKQSVSASLANNLFIHCSTAVYDPEERVMASDFNLYDGSPRFVRGSTHAQIDLVEWSRATQFERHSRVAETRLERGAYAPAANNVAFQMGADQSAFFSDDASGKRRPLGANWGVGAFLR